MALRSLLRSCGFWQFMYNNVEKVLEESGRGLFQVPSQYLSVGTNEHHKHVSGPKYEQGTPENCQLLDCCNFLFPINLRFSNTVEYSCPCAMANGGRAPHIIIDTKWSFTPWQFYRMGKNSRYSIGRRVRKVSCPCRKLK